MLPSTMTVIEAEDKGGPDVLKVAERPVPEPGKGEVLIEVHAAGVNRPDVLQRMGLYPAPKDASDLLGLEVAGRIVKCGEGANRFAEGDEVCALVNGGGYAQYAVAPEATTLKKPENLSFTEAAALPETVFTVWHNVFERGQLKEGDWLLVHGGSSGIGTTAIQMATLKGAKVIVTAGTDEKCHACEELGATKAINYKKEDFVGIVKEITDRHGADVILDMVGGDYIEKDIHAAATEGRIVQIAFLQGSKVEVDLVRLMMRRLTLTGSTLRAQSDAAKAAMARAIETAVWPLVEEGKLAPVMDSTFDLKDVAEAHKRIDDPHHIGKIVLSVEHG
ncbi:Phthiocerol synthesis polyketide synthase type I PpsC [Methyloligella halotolerans]|uniref:Phthiocerol synthesis polyketide synthase type I PpsC n=1 Tax=Methyloligella halotolerans TaxID=1177755 RepID=A0A1E2RZF5_9HYPH|nr:NAD(P)H-quinone oxidoreductase [Methyloligella halotolerans]ODA67542.1 Phthiocerol synthesis polyketide synthase type I PpsC [Methyloligella halotolerans]